jgi:hypothetical protein
MRRLFLCRVRDALTANQAAVLRLLLVDHEDRMELRFYPECESHIDRRRFFKLAMAASLTPALIAGSYNVPGIEAGVQHFIERYALTPDDPWALVHALRAFGRGCSLKGESVATYVLRTCVREQTVNDRRYLYIPASIEVHTNMFLKTFLEAGIPRSEAFVYAGQLFRLDDLGAGAKALFRFNPSTFDRNNLAWSLIAFAELQASEWENAYGQRVQLKDIAHFGLQALQEATQGVEPYFAANLPLPKKMPIHGFTCGGTHLCYSLIVAAKHGFIQAADGDVLQRQLHILVYRLRADPALIDRYYQELSHAAGVDVYRAGAKLKLLGHALECLGYAQANGLLQPSPIESEQIARAAEEVRGLFSYVMTLDLEAVRRTNAKLMQQVVGDTCHAFRGLSLV